MASIYTWMLLACLSTVANPVRIIKTSKQHSQAEILQRPTNRRLLTALLLNLLLATTDAGKDYYSTLGVSKKADVKQIKRAYKKQARRWHPDKHKPKDKDKATAKFQEIAEAYETLTDPEKRKLFDLGGEDAVKGQPQGPPSSHPGTQGGHFTQGGGGPEIDPAMFNTFFQKMAGGNFKQAEGGGGESFSFTFTQPPGHSGMGGFGQGGNPFFQANPGMGGFGQGANPFFQANPGMGSFGQGGNPFFQANRTKKASQGKPFFVQDGGAVRELNFIGHEAKIQKLQNEGNVAVLFYASGGKSCPKACHQIRKPYKDFAAARHKQLPIVAVQCTHRRELCAKYADSFPAVVLFSKGVSQPRVLSASKAVSGAGLVKALDRALLTGRSARQGAEELTAKHFSPSGDPCGGQFCLLLLEHGSTPSRARKALKDAAKMLKDELVTAFYIQESKHPDFVRAFSAPPRRGLWGKRVATQALIYRPRRQTYELFDGDAQDGNALAEFALRIVNRGTPLSHHVLETPKLNM